MNAPLFSKRALQLPIIAFSLLILSACTAIDNGLGVTLGLTQKTAPQLFTPFTENSEYLLKQAEQEVDNESIDWKLAAVQALIKERQYNAADAVIVHLNKKTLSTEQHNALLLLQAENQYAQRQYADSLKTYQKINADLLSDPASLHYLKLSVALFIHQKQHQKATDTLLTLTPLLTDDTEKQHYNDLLLAELSRLPPSVLTQFQQSATPSTDENATLEKELADIEAAMANAPANQILTNDEIFIQGWYALGHLYQRYQLRGSQLKRALDAWKITYATHPVLDFMPTQLSNIPESSAYEANNVAVLLPLTGRFKQPAQALQFGISHAFYDKNEPRIASDNVAPASHDENTAQGEPADGALHIVSSNAPGSNTPALIFIDTNAFTMQEIAEQLHEQNIDFVIGPLLKPNLEALLPLIEGIPTLALNAFPEGIVDNDEMSTQASSLHYAFPLSPENEAMQAAEMMYQKGYTKPLVFAEKSNFGERVSSAFETHWNNLVAESTLQNEPGSEKKQTAEKHLFGSKSEFSRFVGDAMQTTMSQQRINQLQNMLATPLETELRSRRDIDAIYLVSDRSELILMKPFIAVTISPFAKDIPLYASSRSHDSDMHNLQNKELTGLTFSDVSLLLKQKDAREELAALWPKQSNKILRLFALGYDSYLLIEQLNLLQTDENHVYQGLVGELTLDDNNTLNSKLDWAQYQNGSLVEISPTPSGE